MIKKWVWILFLCFFVAGTMSAQGSPRPQEVSIVDLKKHFFIPSCPIYLSVRTELEAYYSRTEFQTQAYVQGWYRVQNFLTWLSLAERYLSTQTIRLEKEEIPLCTLLERAAQDQDSKNLLGMYLGAQYAVNRLGIASPLDKVNFKLHDKVPMAELKGRRLLLTKGARFAQAESINYGLHEMGHMAILSVQKRPQRVLGEMASFYVQHNFGLPVKAQKNKDFYLGIRHVVHSLRQNEHNNYILLEYHSFVAGVVLGKALKREDILKMHSPFKKDISIGAVMRQLLLLKQGKLFFQKEKPSTSYSYVQQAQEPLDPHARPWPYNTKYIQYTPTLEEFVAFYFAKPEHQKALLAFYQTLSKNMEELVFVELEELVFPTPADYTNDPWFEKHKKKSNAFIKKYKTALLKILKQSLDQTPTQVPPIPSGYI